MATKKKDSVWMEPYNIVKLVGASFMLAVTIGKSTYQTIFSKKNAVDTTSAAEHASFESIQEELNQVGGVAAWHRFLTTGLLIQAFFLIFTIAHFLSGEWFIGFELFVVLATTLVLFGYKPWIVRNKRRVSFPKYLRLLKNDMRAMVLWYSYKRLE